MIRSNRSYLMFLLLTSYAEAMEEVSASPFVKARRRESILLVALEEPYNPSIELNENYRRVLTHISMRVDQIADIIKSTKDPVLCDSWSSWVASGVSSGVSSGWAVAKSYARSVEKILKDPESEKLARELIEKINQANNLKKVVEGYTWELDFDTNDLATDVKSKIFNLLYENERKESAQIQIQITYLKEYQKRLERVDELMSASIEAK